MSSQTMFGSLAGFINGNMFTSLYGQEIFVRLPEVQRLQLLLEGGDRVLSDAWKTNEGVCCSPEQWRHNPDKISDLISQSLSWAETLPIKLPAKKKSKKSNDEIKTI